MVAGRRLAGGAVVDPPGRRGQRGCRRAPTWNDALPLPMPFNAMALDEDAGLMMLRWYEPEHWHRLVFGAGIDVDAIKTKATALASTARRHAIMSHQRCERRIESYIINIARRHLNAGQPSLLVGFILNLRKAFLHLRFCSQVARRFEAILQTL